MDNMINQTWLVVLPAALLDSLERVEAGETPEEVMADILDIAHSSMEEPSE
jgi:hypothetical protein